MKDFKRKRKILLISAVIGTLLLLGWLLFLIWFLNGVEGRLTPSEKNLRNEAIKQGESDRAYAEEEKKLIQDHPWFNYLPLSTDKYFLFYDPTRDTFGVDLYLSPSSSPEEINKLKSEVYDYLTSIGVSSKTSKFSWSFINSPNPGL